MINFFLVMLFIWGGYYFFNHPDDVRTPRKFAGATVDLLKDTVDTLPFVYSLGEKAQPPGVLVPTAPSIYTVEVPAWMEGKDTVTPLMGYRARARVLGKAHYVLDREARYSPYDLALGWQDMSDTRMLAQIPIWQSNRRYRYTYVEAPALAPSLIPVESGNMHMIPANAEIGETLHRVVTGDIIDVAGYLVSIQSPDGWSWKSGTGIPGESEDAYKVIWITSLTIEP